MQQLQSVRGTRDLLGTEIHCFDFILKTAQELSKFFGFEHIETPIFEYTSVFKRAVGETTDIVGKEMYTFNDKGGEEITLRPEGTAPVVRALLSNSLTQKLPLKFYYHGAMFRYERPQKGRYRQLHQFGVEVFGLDSPYADVEVIDFGVQLLKALSIKASLHLNTLGDKQSRDAYKSALITYFSKYIHDLSEDSQNRLQRNPLRILDSKNPKDQEIAASAPKGEAYLTKEAAAFFSSVREGLTLLGIDFVHDHSLVRGLDYYTHTAFEFKSGELGAQDAVGGGGRYDGLVEHMGGSAIPAVGWAMGIDRLALLMSDRQFPKINPIAIIVIGDYMLHALKIAHDLRTQGKVVETIYKTNPGKAFKEADRIHASHAIIIGSDEVQSNVVKLKNLQVEPNDPLKEQIIPVHDLSKVLS